MRSEISLLLELDKLWPGGASRRPIKRVRPFPSIHRTRRRFPSRESRFCARAMRPLWYGWENADSFVNSVLVKHLISRRDLGVDRLPQRLSTRAVPQVHENCFVQGLLSPCFCTHLLPIKIILSRFHVNESRKRDLLAFRSHEHARAGGPRRLAQIAHAGLWICKQ